jgi:LysM repeat protein
MTNLITTVAEATAAGAYDKANGAGAYKTSGVSSNASPAPSNSSTPSDQNSGNISTNSGYTAAPATPSQDNTNSNTSNSIPTPLTPSQQSQYNVAKGDTLSSIATKYGTSINALMQANPNIKNPNSIQAGSSLNLPKGVFAGGTPGSSSPSGSAANIQSQYYNALNGTNPNDASDVRSAASTVDTSGGDGTPDTNDLVNSALDDYKNTYNTLVNYESSTKSVAEFQAEGAAELGIPEMDTQLMNVKNLMNGGSEQNITDEINSAGSFATQGQIENLTYSVNKTLLLQANALQTAIDGAQENLSNATSAYQGDQTRTIQAFQDKLASDSSFITMQQTIQNKAAENYNKIVSNAGYKALAGTLTASDPTGQSLRYAESSSACRT